MDPNTPQPPAPPVAPAPAAVAQAAPVVPAAPAPVSADTKSHYVLVLTDLIKKQMVMLGPNVALGQARKVAGFSVGEDGTVADITGDPQQVLTEVAKQYMALSGQIAQMTLESIIAKYPDVKVGT
jgi:hypothetical protein